MMQVHNLDVASRPSSIKRVDRKGPERSIMILMVAFAAAMATVSAAAGDLSEAESRYQQDRAACVSGNTNQDRATCLREAGAALAEAKRGLLAHDDEQTFEKNRVIRCEPLPAGDREDCLRRMRGEGTVSGSVEGGGVYRELVTIVPGPPPR